MHAQYTNMHVQHAITYISSHKHNMPYAHTTCECVLAVCQRALIHNMPTCNMHVQHAVMHAQYACGPRKILRGNSFRHNFSQSASAHCPWELPNLCVQPWYLLQRTPGPLAGWEWLSHLSLTICFQAGLASQHLQSRLQKCVWREIPLWANPWTLIFGLFVLDVAHACIMACCNAYRLLAYCKYTFVRCVCIWHVGMLCMPVSVLCLYDVLVWCACMMIYYACMTAYCACMLAYCEYMLI